MEPGAGDYRKAPPPSAPPPPPMPPTPSPPPPPPTAGPSEQWRHGGPPPQPESAWIAFRRWPLVAQLAMWVLLLPVPLWLWALHHGGIGRIGLAAAASLLFLSAAFAPDDPEPQPVVAQPQPAAAETTTKPTPARSPEPPPTLMPTERSTPEPNDTTTEVTTTAPESGAVSSLVADEANRHELPEFVDGVVPDLIGMDLQLAQDVLQHVGLLVSDTFDASGEGRAQILDSGWVVVEQTFAAGTTLEDADGLELGVVRWGEQGTPAEAPYRDGRIPPVVCLDAQLAEDLLKAHGFFDVEIVDEDGDPVFFDRGNVVARQEPGAGTEWLPDRNVRLVAGRDVTGCS